MMRQKIAVAIVHGVGTQTLDFSNVIQDALNRQFSAEEAVDIVIEPVYWAEEMQEREAELWQRLQRQDQPLNFSLFRKLMVYFVADAFGYQITEYDRRLYDKIHAKFGETLRRLVDRVGETAPLCIIAHSLGSVIASNFIYDLQHPHLLTPELQEILGSSPLANGATLAMFYTLGSPLALWSLPFDDFGTPVTIPDSRLMDHYPQLVGEWVNYYDKDDIIGFPLRGLNRAYWREVNADKQLDIGNRFVKWTPLSHLHYWDDKQLVTEIATTLKNALQVINT